MTISLMRAAGAAAMAGRRRTLGGVPVNTVPPLISGTVAHGNVLTVTPGTWTGSPSLSYQWYAGASPISGETGSTYTVDRADVSIGPAITCRETDSVGATFASSNALSYYPTQDYRCVWDAALGVTLVGSDVDQWANQGTGANTLAAPASGNRPLFTASDADFAGEPSLTFDGANEYLRIAAASMGGSLAFFAPGGCFRVGAGAANQDRVMDYGTTYGLRITVGPGAPYIVATGSSIATTDVRSSTRSFAGRAEFGVSQTIYVSGTAEDTDANVTGAPADGQQLSVGGSSTGTLTLPFSTPLVVCGVSSASASARAILDLNSYCAWRFGSV